MEYSALDKSLKRELVDASRREGETLNLLNFGCFNENAHTSILAALLRHREGMFVRSFLSVILDKPENEIPNEEFEIREQKAIPDGRIPDLVICSNSLFVVVENKVCGAGDGDGQLDDYWNQAVSECERRAAQGNECKPYLVYLTLAGGTPAGWRFGTSDKEDILSGQKDGQRSCSYRDQILDWLCHRVLPECHHRERQLISSLEAYVGYLKTKCGSYPNGPLVESLKGILVRHDRSLKDIAKMYAFVAGQRWKLILDQTNDVAVVREHDALLAAFEAVRQEMLNANVFLDPWEAAYHMKWLLRNNPTLRYRNRGRFDMGAFGRVTQFTYHGDRYVQCATTGLSPDVRIHIHFKSNERPEGPYVFDEILRHGVSEKSLVDAGLVHKGNAFWEKEEPKNGTKGDCTSEDLVTFARRVVAFIRKLEALAPCLRRSVNG